MTKKAVTDKTVVRDSVVISYKTETQYVTDTTYIEIPEISEKTITPDSASHLENKYATSDAKILPDGSLYHDLIMLPQTIPKPYDKEIITNTKDTEKKHQKDKERIVEVEKPIPLAIRIWAFVGKCLLILLSIKIIFKYIYSIFKKHR